MSLTFVYEGLAELQAALRSLPDELLNEASTIVETRTLNAASRIRAAYNSRGVPELAARVKAKVVRTNVSAIGRVTVSGRTKSGQSLALLYEIGTEARHTGKGYSRGKEPPHPSAVPVIIASKTEMYDELRAMLASHGFEVSG